jgi:hypothetical protein
VQVNAGGGSQVEARAGDGKGRGEACDGDGEAGLDRDGGGGLCNRDRSRIGARVELDRAKGKQTDGYRKRASSPSASQRRWTAREVPPVLLLTLQYYPIKQHEIQATARPIMAAGIKALVQGLKA